MQIRVVSTDSAHLYQFHFSRDLPVMPNRLPHPRQDLPIGFPVFPLDRRTPIRRLARRVARLNRGRFCVELANPVSVFSKFLFELIHTPGVDSIDAMNRYTVQVRVACFFGLTGTARLVGECVARHFYPDETVDVEVTEAARARHHEGDLVPSAAEMVVSQLA